MDQKRDRSPLTQAQLEAVARRFRALSSPSRLQILDALMSGPLGMAALGGRTGLTQSNLSRQTSELEVAGCVRRSRVGREVVVEIADDSLSQLCELVCGSLLQQASAAHHSLRG